MAMVMARWYENTKHGDLRPMRTHMITHLSNNLNHEPVAISVHLCTSRTVSKVMVGASVQKSQAEAIPISFAKRALSVPC